MSQAKPIKRGSVLRNTLMLVGAQVAGTPLAILMNAVMGRYLGPAAFGDAYLAWTLMNFGFLLVEWGHGGVLPAAIAQNHARVGSLLGSSLVWRLGSGIVVSAALSAGCLVLGYPLSFQVILALAALQALLGTFCGAIQDALRGLEQIAVTALSRIGLQVAMTLFVIPTLMLGGKLNAAMLAQALASALILLLVWHGARRGGIRGVRFAKEDFVRLFKDGSAFLVFSIAVTLQGNIDAIFLSKLATAEVIGWFAAARRLSGLLVMPALSLIGALYPTLARLHVQDQQEFKATTNSSLRSAAILAVPLAVCCAVYREVGVALFSKDSFEPAGQNLLVLSGLIFLVYFSMPLGCALLAAGRQRAWSLAQSSCVLVSVALNPLLIPYCQEHYGNGGLGVCIAAVVTEVFKLIAAIWLAPSGLLERSLAKTVLQTLAAGVGMAAVAWLLRGLSPYLAAPISVLAYGGCLWLLGGLDREFLERAWSSLRARTS
jgi:O-antigen/teichoic acid export membrane protein